VASIGAAISETIVGRKSKLKATVGFVQCDASNFAAGQAGEWSSQGVGHPEVGEVVSWQSEQQSCESTSIATADSAQPSEPASQMQTPVGKSNGRHASSVSNRAENAITIDSRNQIFQIGAYSHARRQSTEGQRRRLMATIREVLIPEELLAIRDLFREYEASLDVDLCFQGFEDELAALPGKYSRPAGGIWLAVSGSELAGCVAMRPLDADRAEMKRLFVRDSFRGLGLGRSLVEQVFAEAAKSGYRRICLDTLPSMKGAIALYRSLGFEEIEPYCRNPVEGALFLERSVSASSGPA
jgi:ribosomal protein S18 acetylase RimI-like enzyme